MKGVEWERKGSNDQSLKSSLDASKVEAEIKKRIELGAALLSTPEYEEVRIMKEVRNNRYGKYM